MLVFSSVKREFSKSPLAISLALIALFFVYYGYTGPLNAQSPKVVVVKEVVNQRGTGDSIKFYTEILIENLGDNTADVRLDALMWNRDGKKIDILNNDNNGPTKFELYPNKQQGILPETTEYPAVLVVCLTADSVEGFGSSKFSAIYETTQTSVGKLFKIGNKQKFSRHIRECEKLLT
ncbi:hypothetical protein [Thalassospira sp.]|uniref:hypothetical protein n=1 Tax=Thalassospira sp. TaxID=1912094 RepID=UPI002630DBBF|nr:hypothetical protein [Thalassospira sp.]MCH2274506.1 hypothetical protein [Thalassospira sp.]